MTHTGHGAAPRSYAFRTRVGTLGIAGTSIERNSQIFFSGEANDFCE